MRSLMLPLLVVLLACGGKSVVGGGSTSGTGGTASGTGTTTTGSAGTSGIGGSGGTLPTDGGVEECAPCVGGPEGPATYGFHPCTPPLEVGCEATECTPGGTDCSDGYTCEEWGAAACCWCAQAVPACVFTELAQGPLPPYLKISPASGPAGQDATLQIEGYPFYVGALFYLVRVGDSDELFQEGGSTCSFSVTVPGRPAGVEPVWVSQYGGGEPWVLAGFFEWLDGGYPAGCGQPGFPCGDDMGPCCESQDVPMACVEGRCRRL